MDGMGSGRVPYSDARMLSHGLRKNSMPAMRHSPLSLYNAVATRRSSAGKAGWVVFVVGCRKRTMICVWAVGTPSAVGRNLYSPLLVIPSIFPKYC